MMSTTFGDSHDIILVKSGVRFKMRIMARQGGILDRIYQCAECGEPMIKVGTVFKCMQKVEPEELVAVGFIPRRDSKGNLTFDLSAKDQLAIEATQAYNNSVEIDNAYLEKLGLNLDKIREYQLQHNLVP